MSKNNILKKFALIAAGAMMLPAFAAADIKMGIILGFTGPIESLTPDMGNSAELAFKEASDSGQLLGGQKISVVRADSTCIDAAAATAAAERLITSDKVAGIMGADCSGVTTAIANNVAVPNGVTMISPSATSPALSTIADNGYFFRTAPSDARQGQVLAEITMGRGFNDVAVTFINNDYGKGLSDSFINAYKGLGGKLAQLFLTKQTKLISLLKLEHSMLPDQAYSLSLVMLIRAAITLSSHPLIQEPLTSSFLLTECMVTHY